MHIYRSSLLLVIRLDLLLFLELHSYIALCKRQELLQNHEVKPISSYQQRPGPQKERNLDKEVVEKLVCSQLNSRYE